MYYAKSLNTSMSNKFVYSISLTKLSARACVRECVYVLLQLMVCWHTLCSDGTSDGHATSDDGAPDGNTDWSC